MEIGCIDELEALQLESLEPSLCLCGDFVVPPVLEGPDDLFEMKLRRPEKSSASQNEIFVNQPFVPNFSSLQF